MLKKRIFNAGFYLPNRHGGLGNFAKAGLEHPRANGLYENLFIFEYRGGVSIRRWDDVLNIYSLNSSIRMAQPVVHCRIREKVPNILHLYLVSLVTFSIQQLR